MRKRKSEAVLTYGGPNKNHKKHKGDFVDVTKADITRLDEGEWFNDNLVDFYLKVLRGLHDC